MNTTINKKCTNSLIHLILACIIVLWINGGAINYIFRFMPDIFKILLFSVWIGVSIIYNKKFAYQYIMSSIPLLLFSFILLVASKISDLSTINYYLKVCIFLMMIYALFLYYYSFYPRHIPILISVVLIDDFLIIINTLIHLRNIPNLSRYLSMSEDKIILYLGKPSSDFIAIGNYTFAYSLVFVGLYFLYKALKQSRHTWYYLILYFIIYYILVKMEFTIALILYFATTLLYVCILSTHKKLYMILIQCCFILFCFVLYAGIPQVLNQISNFTPGGIAVRLNEIGDLINSNLSKKADLNLRLNLYNDSLQCFLQSIWGGYICEPSGTIGGHSTLLDFLGSFGLLSCIPFLFFCTTFIFTLRRIEKSAKGIYICGIFYYFTLSTINTTFSPRILLYLFLIFPLMLSQNIVSRKSVTKIC